MIAGGGFGSGAVDGVVNLYAIDDVTRAPIADAKVTIGDTVSGVTNEDGLFTVLDDSLVGPQQVVITADGYRSELWVGANGANMTADLKPLNVTVPQATLSGSINGMGAITVGTGHLKLAAVTYSNDETLDDSANNIKTAMDKNVCAIAAGASTGCTFDVVTRTGKVSLLALIFDFDNKGTAGTTDDTLTLIGYAKRTGVDVMGGVNQTGVDLDVIAPADLVTETVAFGTPPSGLSVALGLVGVELSDGSGVFQIPLANAAMTSGKVPALSVFPGSQYRLTAIAQNTAMPPTTSAVIRRHVTSATLDVGAWVAPPTNVSLSRTHASWTPSPDGTVHGVEYFSAETSVLNISSFDNTADVTIPDSITLASGTLTAKVNALSAPTIDLGDIELDRDRDKIVGAGTTPAQVN